MVPEISTPTSPIELLLDIVPENVLAAAANADMLAVIFFSILFGISIAGLPEAPRIKLTGLFDAGFQAMMRLTSGIIRVAPLGVFGLITRVVGTSGLESFRALGLYMVTISVSLTFHLLVTLPLLLLTLGRIRPPMGATVNMDGTALYECAGVLFIAQVLGAELSLGQQMVVVLTALLASIGAAAVPSAGLVIIFIVLESVNLRGPEVEAVVGAMLAIDRPLDMYRTAVNVFSDSCGAAIIARSEGESEVDTVVVT